MGTAAGTILLVGAKAGVSSPSDQATKPAADEPPPGVTPSGSAPPDPSAAPRPVASGKPGASTGTTTAPAPGKTTAPGRPKPTTAASDPPRTAMKDGTFKGDAVYVDYGTVELSIVVSGGKITDIKVLDSPSDHSRSVRIGNAVLPKLRAEALAAQSADVDSVSGATYTSSGYKMSLQSAIDRAYRP
ncbi:FMN-binding protein [Dactylosporangium roseum]|uniref:FMN-binding protein n=1 Tax=Dactylosporangium roseum TaxID=47989 RepID=A0ABY5ZBL6_9ACTN|nr:FMN-binding protein [Dactylosporangium roseum]UWZ37724.1 FMN-binding protein [Dactylosporangium roseum]